jgi:hypothetical protein
LRELPYVVECSMGRFFEPIAAFNCISVARSYLADCAATNPMFEYRLSCHYEESDTCH